MEEKKEVQSVKPTEQVQKETPKVESSKIKSSTSEEFIAVIRIRGGRRIGRYIQETIDMLNLKNQHNLIIIPNKPSYVGMLKKAKDYITWGKISPKFKKELETKKSKGDSKVIRLHPPRGGFERKGIKAPFTMGGVLGDRGSAISDLIKRML